MTDTRVLLLTDVVDSTQLNQQLGDAAIAALWAAHDRAARDLLPTWRGREIDKTDGMLLLFGAVDDAVHYAQAYQHSLASLSVPLRARAAVHVGPVLLRENTAQDIARGAKPLELDGMAKPIVARVASLAGGGQLLLSQAAAAALAELTALAPPPQLHSHGHWSLKGLAEPMEVFELCQAEAEPSTPADNDKAQRVVLGVHGWVPLREVPNNLPQPVTSFVGREQERGEIAAHLQDVRLLTLLGMGGLGKTRLSLQVAEQIKHRCPDGVWFIDLSPIRDPALVAGETAQVLGVRDEPDRPLVQTLCAHLKTRRVLLVLDNCEHLLQATADLAHALLRAAPQLRILASSREALRVPGELAYPVLPLPLPGRDEGAQALMQSPAVRLFVDRARLHKPGFELGAREAPAVAELVARLEGIPLALELAAARVRTLSVADINLRLRDRYKLLTGGSRALQERQQTLRALVDWSYDLLVPAEQTLLQRLSVFVGGFDLSAAEAVCGSEPLDADDVMDLLSSLVEKSLVMMDEPSTGTRYRMLETIRDYAHDKLVQAAALNDVALRHCEHYFALAKQAREGLKGAEQAQWIERLEAELDNLRSATALALAGGADPFIAVKLAVALQGFWILRGYATEGRAVVQSALALPAIQAHAMAQGYALYVGAALAFSQGDHLQARQMLQDCLALRRGLDRAVDVAATLSTLSLATLRCGDVQAAAACEREALDIFRELGDEVGIAIGLQNLGRCDMAAGDATQARMRLAQGLAIAQRLGHREIEAECERLVGEIELDALDVPAAQARFEQSLSVSRAAGDKQGQAQALRWLARAALRNGNPAAAAEPLGQALRAFRNYEMRDELLACLEDHAQLAQCRGHLGLAVQLAACVEQLRLRLALARLPWATQRWQEWLCALRAALPADAFERDWLAGEPWTLDEAMRQAVNAL